MMTAFFQQTKFDEHWDPQFSCSSPELETIDLIAANNSLQNTIQQNTQAYPGVRCNTNARIYILSVIQTLVRLVSLQMRE